MSDDDYFCRRVWMDAYLEALEKKKKKVPPKPKIDPKKPVLPCEKANLVVKVTDYGGKPIEDAIVNVVGIGGMFTDKNGFADYGEVSPGTYDITAEKDGYRPAPGDPIGPATTTEDVPCNQTTVVPLKLCGCTITSETVATSPANRARKKIGVGEEVELTVSPSPATWSITTGGGTLSPSTGSHAKVTYMAVDKAESVTITATGAAGCTCVITFTVVKPSSWTMKRQPGTNLKHTNGWPDCGWKGIMYVHPNDVNFYRIETREKDSQQVASGSYSGFTGNWHGNYPPPGASAWFPIVRHSDADGSTDDAPDEIYSGYPGSAAAGTAPPFNVGSSHFPITIQWRVVGSGTIHDFSSVRQEHEIFADGKCESRKGSHTEHTMYNDATSTY